MGVLDRCWRRRRAAPPPGHLSVARHLLEDGGCGGGPNAALADGCTPLIAAARFGHVEVCRLLLLHGASREAEVWGNAVIGSDGTAAEVARFRGRGELADLLEPESDAL